VTKNVDFFVPDKEYVIQDLILVVFLLIMNDLTDFEDENYFAYQKMIKRMPKDIELVTFWEKHNI
jgi:hypothetical protein